MNDRIKDYFSFNRKEQRGLLILLGAMVCLLGFRYGLSLRKPEESFDIEPFRKEVDAFMQQIQFQDSVSEATPQARPAFITARPVDDLSVFKQSPFLFDPNQLDEAGWKTLGLNERTAAAICKYREKGGKFRKKEDLRKIYTLADSVFIILEPWISISSETSFTPSQKKIQADSMKKSSAVNPSAPAFPLVELNTADSVALTMLRGIGPSFAMRILRYRNSLGGFFDSKQVMEVKGMDPERYELFRDQIALDTSAIEKMDLNSTAFKEMLRHPYFEYYLVKSIFRMKDEIGSFDSVAQLRDLDVMYEELFEKIRPYLEVLPPAPAAVP